MLRRFCKSAHAAIVKKAEKTYNRVIEAKDEVLNKNSCDFKLLEEACLRYEAEML